MIGHLLPRLCQEAPLHVTRRGAARRAAFTTRGVASARVGRTGGVKISSRESQRSANAYRSNQSVGRARLSLSAVVDRAPSSQQSSRTPSPFSLYGLPLPVDALTWSRLRAPRTLVQPSSAFPSPLSLALFRRVPSPFSPPPFTFPLPSRSIRDRLRQNDPTRRSRCHVAWRPARSGPVRSILGPSEVGARSFGDRRRHALLLHVCHIGLRKVISFEG